MSYQRSLLFVALALVMVFALAPAVFASDIPQGNVVTLSGIETTIRNFVRLLLRISGTIAVLFLLIAGIYYMYAGGEPDKVKKAQAMFWSGIKGALIIFGVGVILNTIQAIFTGDFFY